MEEAERLLSAFVNEGLAICGFNNMSCVEDHVRKRIAELDPERRKLVEEMMRQMGGLHEPPAPPYKLN